MPLPEIIVIPIKTLTPIFTGDADRKTSYIKGSSLLGGLRFWTEALVRSFGEEVCDITSDNEKDTYDKETNSNICKVCEIFGCTGKGRSFSLKVSGQGKNQGMGKIELTDYQHGRKPPAWFLREPGKMGDFRVEILPLRDKTISPKLALALALMLKWGTLGAKDQFGFGLVEAEIPDRLIELAKQAVPTKENEAYNGLSFQDFFYFNARAEEQDLRLPFEIRYLVRRSLAESMPLRHYFCGSMMGRDKCATKFNIGLAEERIRGWGFFPKKGRFSNNRDQCLNNLKNTIAEKCAEESLLWREYHSVRDPEMGRLTWPQFLEELLKGGVS
jgi:CRISPR-associated protein Cmr1